MKKFLQGSDILLENIDEQRKNYLDALRFFTGTIIESRVKPKEADHTFVSAVTGLVYCLLNEHIPKELLAFSKHAGRKNIKVEDLYLYLRKTSFVEILKQ